VGRAESGEVVATDEVRGGLGHRGVIERLRNLPHQPLLERQRRAAVQYAIDIGAAHAGKAGVPVVRLRFAREDRYRIRPEMRIERLHQTEGRDVFRNVRMGAHREAVDARIRPTRAMHHRRFAGNPLQRLLDRLLHGGAVRLPLPAHERAAIKLHREGEAGHASLVPAGIG
jgi:hypothetical protein